MSHITVIRHTQITDVQGLVKALEDLGLTHVEIRAGGGRLGQPTQVVTGPKLLRAFGGGLRFRQRREGTFDAIIPDGARGTYSREWLQRLTQRYTYHVARAKLEEQGFTLVSEETQPGEQIHLVLRRMA